MDLIDFICFSINYWEKRKDRKHQFMLSLSQKENVGKVLYIEPSMNFIRLFLYPFSELNTAENRHRWWRALTFKVEKIRDKFYVVSPLFLIPLWRFYPIYKVNRLFTLLVIKLQLKKLGIKKPVIWLYHPYDECILDFMKERTASCFDWAELWSEWFIEFSPKRLRFVAELERRIIKKSDVNFVVSEELLRRAKIYNPNSFFLGSGAPVEMFKNIDNNFTPPDIKEIHKPIIGYVGTIGERVDVSLLLKISNSFPDASLVIIGRILRDRIDISTLNDLKNKKNVYFLGEKEYQLLPSYILNFKVGIIPYLPEKMRLNEPTKHYDYLAAGKPVVSTALVELMRFKDLILIADTHDEFLKLLREAINKDDANSCRKRLNFIEKNSWSARADEILERINTLIENK